MLGYITSQFTSLDVKYDCQVGLDLWPPVFQDRFDDFMQRGFEIRLPGRIKDQAKVDIRLHMEASGRPARAVQENPRNDRMDHQICGCKQ